MIIGHINLARSINGTGEHIIALVEALDRQGIRQHVVVRNDALARRLRLYDNVSVGPVTGAAVIAYCLMPAVDVVHAHENCGAQAALLLKLTRSIPFVLSHRTGGDPDRSAVTRSVYGRASGIVCATEAGAGSLVALNPAEPINVIRDISRATVDDLEMAANRAAARHMRVYQRAVETSSVPAMLL